MSASLATPATFSEYTRRLPKAAKQAVRQIRQAIKNAAPGARDTISYGMPAMRWMGCNFISYAAFKEHVSIFPVPRGTELLRKQMAPYRSGRGTLSFALPAPLPMGLIRRIVGALVRELKEKQAGRSPD